MEPSSVARGLAGGGAINPKKKGGKRAFSALTRSVSSGTGVC